MRCNAQQQQHSSSRSRSSSKEQQGASSKHAVSSKQAASSKQQRELMHNKEYFLSGNPIVQPTEPPGGADQVRRFRRPINFYPKYKSMRKL